MSTNDFGADSKRKILKKISVPHKYSLAKWNERKVI